MVRGTGRDAADVARAWLIASRLIGYRELVSRLGVQDSGMAPATAYRWLRGLGRVLERTARWILTNEATERDATDVVEENLSGLARLRHAFPDIVSGEDRRIFQRLVEEIRADGAEEGFARSLITLRFLDQLLEVLRVHRRTGVDPLEVARTFYRVSELYWIPWIRQVIFSAAGDDRWEQRAAQALSDDLTWAHQRFVAAIMGLRSKTDSVEEAVEALTAGHGTRLKRYEDLVSEVESEGRIGLPALTVVVRELMALAEGVEIREA